MDSDGFKCFLVPIYLLKTRYSIARCSMVLEYLPTFTPKMTQLCKYSSTMEHLGCFSRSSLFESQVTTAMRRMPRDLKVATCTAGRATPPDARESCLSLSLSRFLLCSIYVSYECIYMYMYMYIYVYVYVYVHIYTYRLTFVNMIPQN